MADNASAGATAEQFTYTQEVPSNERERVLLGPLKSDRVKWALTGTHPLEPAGAAERGSCWDFLCQYFRLVPALRLHSLPWCLWIDADGWTGMWTVQGETTKCLNCKPTECMTAVLH